MASHGFDPGNPNIWYQSPHLGLILVGYGGGIAGNCYNHSPVGASYHSVTNFTHPNFYPPPHHFTQPNPYPPPQHNYYAPPPHHFTQPHSYPAQQHKPSATLINGHLLPLQFPCASQTQAQYYPSPHLHPIAPQPLTTTPQISSIPSYSTPHPNPNLRIHPLISPNSSHEPLVVHSHLWRARYKQVALELTAATGGVKKPSRFRLGTVLPCETGNSQKRNQLLIRKPKFQRLLGAITQDCYAPVDFSNLPEARLMANAFSSATRIVAAIGNFKNRFSSAGNQAGNRDFSFCDLINGGISDFDNDLILAPATMLEVEKAVNSIGSLKAPGPDGLNALFFQKNWESLKGAFWSLFPSRGLRQGDPLSPYIFILCMEPLIRHLNLAADKPKNHVGILSSPKGIRISNLLFAEDCLIFGRASSTAARNIDNILRKFAASSGQQINLDKSSIYFSNKTQASLKVNISNLLGIKHKTTIGRYLGIHNIVFWKDPQNARELLIKISKRLSGWKGSTLSRAGKTILLKSNASAIPNHVLLCFKCHSKIAKAMEKEMRSFFWGKGAKVPPIAWDQTLETLFISGMRWIIGNGKNIKFWTFNWVYNFPLINLLDYSVKDMTDVDATVADFIENGCWNFPKLISCLDRPTVNVISSINIPIVDFEDEFVWGPASNGVFSVKSAMWMQMSDASAAAGYILRNSDCNPLVAGAMRLYSSNVHVLECLALKDGILAANRFNHKNLLVEEDSLLVINSLWDLANAPWKIKPILCDILHLAHSFDNISFTHIFLESNFMTDALANTGHALQCPKIWLCAKRTLTKLARELCRLARILRYKTSPCRISFEVWGQEGLGGLEDVKKSKIWNAQDLFNTRPEYGLGETGTRYPLINNWSMGILYIKSPLKTCLELELEETCSPGLSKKLRLDAARSSTYGAKSDINPSPESLP
ncbi:hypothetical protein ACLB2K_060482 [Fragaria x ananassa]